MRMFPLIIGVLVTVLPGLLGIGPVAAQDDDQDRVRNNYLKYWESTEPPTATPAVLDQLAIASFLADAEIDVDDYRIAAAIARRLEQEGVSTDELSSLYVTDRETRLTYRILGIVAVANLLLFAGWRWITVRSEGKS